MEFQLELVRQLGIDASAAGLPHHEAYAQLVDVLHLEEAIRSRFSDRSPPRGLVGRIVSAAVKCFGLSDDQTRKFRKAIGRCLKGERNRVALLRVNPSSRRRG